MAKPQQPQPAQGYPAEQGVEQLKALGCSDADLQPLAALGGAGKGLVGDFLKKVGPTLIQALLEALLKQQQQPQQQKNP